MDYVRGLIGILFILGLGYVLSSSRRTIDWKLVAVGVLMQIYQRGISGFWKRTRDVS
jgi:concentrative nucleoside transporter, CNT family